METQLKGFDIDYMISDNGDIRKPTGHVLVPMKLYNGIYVTLRMNGKLNKRSLAALVLHAFRGGYAKNRRVKYLDGDRTNCKLSNLRWMYGWNGKIDLSLKKNPNKNDKLVWDYLRTKDDMTIVELIKQNAGIVWLLTRQRGMGTYIEDVKTELYIRLKEAFDGGRYRPEQDNILALIKSITRLYLRDIRPHEYRISELTYKLKLQ